MTETEKTKIISLDTLGHARDFLDWLDDEIANLQKVVDEVNIDYDDMDEANQEICGISLEIEAITTRVSTLAKRLKLITE